MPNLMTRVLHLRWRGHLEKHRVVSVFLTSNASRQLAAQTETQPAASVLV
uniref:Uncharacterized protein n=1 Tax=Anguilla anguilla TaxID=7936 RepID=A0A0E9WQC2_ANGAN